MMKTLKLIPLIILFGTQALAGSYMEPLSGKLMLAPSASSISVDNSTSGWTGTNAQAVLDEIQVAISSVDSIPGDTVNNSLIDAAILDWVSPSGISLVDSTPDAAGEMGWATLAGFTLYGDNSESLTILPGSASNTLKISSATGINAVVWTSMALTVDSLTIQRENGVAQSWTFYEDPLNGDNKFTITATTMASNIGWTLPSAAPGGSNYLLNVDADGTMGYTDPSTLGSGHDALTLGATATAILGLSTQELGFDTQTANYALMGPTSGAAAAPTFRALVAGDIPDLSSTYTTTGHTHAAYLPLAGGTMAGDILMGNGLNIKTDTTTAHTLNLQAYDVNGTAYDSVLTITNGDTPTLTIATDGNTTIQGITVSPAGVVNIPTGGKIQINGVDYVSAGTDGTHGLITQNNTTREPTASAYEQYADGGIWKTNQNGTEYTNAFLDKAQTFTSVCTWNSSGIHKQVATPSNPSSGHNRLYFKSDDKLYKLTSAGVETEVAGGSGTVEDDVYGSGWDTDTTHSPSQNAVYDKIETMPTLSGNNVFTGSNDFGNLGTLLRSMLDSTPATDSTGGGIYISVVSTSGLNISAGDLVVVANTGDTGGPIVKLADADSSTTVGAVFLALESINAGASGKVLVSGIARLDSWAWTGANKALYISTTAGDITQTKPTGSGDQQQKVGYTLTPHIIIFNPSPNIYTAL